MESGQRLENVERTHLVLTNGELALQKNFSESPSSLDKLRDLGSRPSAFEMRLVLSAESHGALQSLFDCQVLYDGN